MLWELDLNNQGKAELIFYYIIKNKKWICLDSFSFALSEPWIWAFLDKHSVFDITSFGQILGLICIKNPFLYII